MVYMSALWQNYGNLVFQHIVLWYLRQGEPGTSQYIIDGLLWKAGLLLKNHRKYPAVYSLPGADGSHYRPQ